MSANASFRNSAFVFFGIFVDTEVLRCAVSIRNDSRMRLTTRIHLKSMTGNPTCKHKTLRFLSKTLSEEQTLPTKQVQTRNRKVC